MTDQLTRGAVVFGSVTKSVGDNQRAQPNVSFCGRSGQHLLAASISASDVVDGAHSAASKCHRVIESKHNHIEGSRPWARLSRSASILRSRCFKFMASMQMALW